MLLKWFARIFAVLAVAPALAQAPAIVDAEPARPPLNEAYDDSAPVSGSPLVGMRLGALSAVADSNSVVVVAPPEAGSQVCLRVTTRDGRFSASNLYDPGGGLPQFVRLRPLADRYRAQLSNYPADEIGFRAFASTSSDCIPARAVNLPVYDAASGPATPLVLFANGKSQPATAALYRTDAAEPPDGLDPVVSAACTPPVAGSMIAYDLVCRLDLPAGFSGRALVALEFSDGFSTDRYYYATAIPGAAP